MTCVKDFEFELCFVNENSKLSNLKPVQSYTSNLKLSKIIAYFYTIIRYGTNDVVWVDETVFDVLKEFFPDSVKILNKKDISSDDVEGWTITEVNAAEVSGTKYKEGEIMMPIYVLENSTIVYNIHRVDANKIEYTTEYVMGAVNYFNCIIRSQTSGIKRVLWKDPVIFSTRLHDTNYDKMLCLYIASKYLSVFEGRFPTEEPLKTLAMCLRFFEILENSVGQITTQPKQVPSGGKITPRQFNNDMLKVLEIPKDFDAKTISPKIGNLKTDLTKRDLSSILIFLNTAAYIPPTSTDHIYITGFKNYSFLDTLTKLYPNAIFEIWETSATIKTTMNVIHHKTDLTPAKLKRKNLILISNLNANDAILKEFTGSAMVVSGGTTMEPSFIFVSCYENPSELSGYIVVGFKKKLLRKTVQDNKEKLKSYAEYIEYNYRDPNKWSYYINDTDKTYSFDDALTEYLFLLSSGKKQN